MPSLENTGPFPCFNKSLKSLKGEEWREIPYTEGYFLISNFGRIKALARYIERKNASFGFWTKDKILSQSCSRQMNRYKGDYTFGMRVCYQFNGQKFSTMARRLVYEVFVKPLTREKMEGKYVYPKDGDGLNSHASNLGLATKSEMRKKELLKDRYIPPAFVIDQEKNRQHLLRMNRTKRRPVQQYNLAGKLLSVFPSITNASKKTGVSISCISACAARHLLQAKGFVWRYEGDTYDGVIHSGSPKKRPVTKYSIGGKILRNFDCIGDAARQSGVRPTEIISTAKKKIKQAGGFVWRYKGEPYKGEFKNEYLRRKVVQCDSNGKKLATFHTISAAAKGTGSNYEGIRRVLSGELKMSNGFIWKYVGKLCLPKREEQFDSIRNEY
jgi:hypothetical protein